jgi:hypothetical protein
MGKSNFDRLENFIEAFMAVAKSHRDTSLQAKDLVTHYLFSTSAHQDRKKVVNKSSSLSAIQAATRDPDLRADCEVNSEEQPLEEKKMLRWLRESNPNPETATARIHESCQLREHHRATASP